MTLPQTRLETRAIATDLPSAADRKPSRWRWIGSAIACHPRIVQLALLLTMLTGTSSYLLYSLFKDAWSPEKDNIAILKTIVTLELEREDALPIIDSKSEPVSNLVVTRSYVDLEPYLEIDGWIWINRFGSTITYGRQEEILIASCSTYSPLYLICNLSEIP